MSDNKIIDVWECERCRSRFTSTTAPLNYERCPFCGWPDQTIMGDVAPGIQAQQRIIELDAHIAELEAERDLLLTRCSEKDAVLRYFTDRNRWRVTEDRGSIGAPLYEWDYIGAFAAEDLAGNPADYIRQALSSDGSVYAAVVEAAREIRRIADEGPDTLHGHFINGTDEGTILRNLLDTLDKENS